VLRAHELSETKLCYSCGGFRCKHPQSDRIAICPVAGCRLRKRREAMPQRNCQIPAQPFAPYCRTVCYRFTVAGSGRLRTKPLVSRTANETRDLRSPPQNPVSWAAATRSHSVVLGGIYRGSDCVAQPLRPSEDAGCCGRRRSRLL